MSGRVEKLEQSAGVGSVPLILHQYPDEPDGSAQSKYEAEHGPIADSALVVVIQHSFRSGI